MADIIIGIHGMGNKPPAKTLQTWWKAPLREGLKRINKPKRVFNLEIFYWAHYIHPEPLLPRIRDKKHPLYIQEPYAHSGKTTRTDETPSKIRQKILNYLNRQLDSFFLKPDFTVSHESIAGFLIHHFSSDLETYYSRHCILPRKKDCSAKSVICSNLADLLKKHRRKKIMLIAHSMGAIIAYDVLTQYVPEVRIDTLVTLGAPLGLPVIKSRFLADHNNEFSGNTALKTPENVVGNWYNLSDLKDKIAINYKLSDDFEPNSLQVRPVDLIVTNDYEFRGNKNPHKAYGYLRTPEMAGIVNNFLSDHRQTLMARLKKFLKKKNMPS